jgi:alpha-mannosidase
LAVAIDSGSAGLPSDGSLLTVEPAGPVALGALKATGNPTAVGSAGVVDPANITFRLVETLGARADVQITTSVGEVTDITAADLLEQPRRNDKHPLNLHGYQIATLATHFDVEKVIDATGEKLAPDAEPAQPLYARYWLHNRGPAPLGGLPAVAHLHPEAVAAQPGQTVRLRLSVASDCSDADLKAAVRTIHPPGWGEQARMFAGRSYDLPPRGHHDAEITVEVPDDAEPGHYPVRVELSVSGDVPPSWRQRVEDVCVVTVGDPGEDLVRLVDSGTPDIVVSRGGTSRLTATVASGARADLHLEAHLISPWGTWEWMGPASLGATLPARSSVDVGFDITPPPWVTPGRWWALIRIGCAGRLLYTPAVAVTVR